MNKRLLARSAAALLAAPLVLLAVQGTSGGVSASSQATKASVVAQARANFIKVKSAHAPVVGGSHGWVSPGAKKVAGKGANGSVTEEQSVNWSGYADSETGSSTVSQVTGSWTIPSVTCLPRPYQNQDAFIANWVGIDGFNDQTVEQLGSATQCFEGVEYYYVWYEMYPAGTVEEGTAACINDNVDCPRPGDHVTASVTVTPAGSGSNSYKLTLVDHTRPQESFSTTRTCAASTCVDSSAEWIVERPATTLPDNGPIQILPLADFWHTGFNTGTVTSAGSTTSIQGFKGGTVYDIPMTDDTQSYYLACVDQPSPPGSLLSDTSSSTCPTAAPGWGGSFWENWDSSF